jgi:hypothetical protein
MRRLAALVLLAASAAGRADQFDYYTHPVLSKAASDGSLKEVKELSGKDLDDATGVLPDSPDAVLVVATNDKRFAKLLAQPVKQKIGGDKEAPLLLIDKYTTYKGTSAQAVQVVPESVGGDFTVTADPKDPNGFLVKPVKDAKLYVLSKPIAGVVPKKAPKLVVGEAFETRFIAGKYKLHDDGRRSGVLKLEVNDAGEITGTFTSDKDGREYDVQGKAGSPKHAITFTIKYPATTQTFTGFVFTGDAKAIAGTAKMLEREAGFYAERIEE